MSTPARRRFAFWCLCVAVVGAVNAVNVATLPVAAALAEGDPAPVVSAGTPWATWIDLAIRVLALILAWLSQPKPPADPEERKTFP